MRAKAAMGRKVAGSAQGERRYGRWRSGQWGGGGSGRGGKSSGAGTTHSSGDAGSSRGKASTSGASASSNQGRGHSGPSQSSESSPAGSSSRASSSLSGTAGHSPSALGQGRRNSPSAAAPSTRTRNAAAMVNTPERSRPVAAPSLLSGLFNLPPLPSARSGGREALPPALIPVTVVATGALALLPMRSLSPPRIAADRASKRTLGACGASIAAAAQRYGAVDVDVYEGGRTVRSPRGGFVAPIHARVTYARGGVRQIRQARVSCQLNGAAKVVALR